MRLLIVFAYFLLFVTSSCFYASIYQTLTLRLNSFLLMSSLPSFTGVGMVGNTTCDNIFLCAHYQCQTRKSYISLNNYNNCDITYRAIKDRFYSSFIFDYLDGLEYINISFFISGMFVTALFGIIILSYEKVNTILNSFCCTIVILLNLVITIYSMFLSVSISNVIPPVPTFYQIIDSHDVIWQISILAAHFLVSTTITVVISLHILKFGEIEVLEFFSKSSFEVIEAGDKEEETEEETE